jgi:UDPglucose 6-dehydrogenase
MNISVIGTGYVGLVTGACLSEAGHDVLCADVDEDKISQLQQGDLPIYEEGLEELVQSRMEQDQLGFTTSTSQAVEHGRVIYIAVGTPATDSGAPDLTAIEQAARDIAANLSSYRIIVEKSTVPVNTGERVGTTIERNTDGDVSFDVVSNPEFLAEGSALEDARNPHRIVVGVTSDKAEETMREIYEPFDAPLIVTDLNSAELIKHASNSFLAMKISYINAVSRICEASGADVDEVARGMGMDPRIGEHFLQAGIGYGGSCFPKDVEAFHNLSKELGYGFDLLRNVQDINETQRDRVLEKIRNELWVLNNKSIGVLGLSFKPGTDDIRESPGIYLIQDLLEEGCSITGYDPKAIENAREVLDDRINYASSPYEAAEDAEALVITTDWPEFGELDLDRLKEEMSLPFLLDARNMYDPETVRSNGFIYESVGRP